MKTGTRTARHLSLLLGIGFLSACGTGATGSSSPGAIQGDAAGTAVAAGQAACPVTKPEPAFTPSGRAGAPARPPAAYQAAWYGDAGLFTMLDLQGEAWIGLPRGVEGFGQKTFWWSEAFDVDAEPMPSISVAGERLDGGGRFVAPGPGTNAAADFGSAMLIGIGIPSAGCWRLTATYREADLSIIVWVGD